MGFRHVDGSEFRIPVSDTQAYRQFGNAVVVPVVGAVAEIMKPHILDAIENRGTRKPKKQPELPFAKKADLALVDG